jgi:hypothetical protein
MRTQGRDRRVRRAAAFVAGLAGLAGLTGLALLPAGAAQAATAPAPAPVLGLVATSPVLTQTGPATWTTTVLVTDSGTAVSRGAFTLVPLSPVRRLATGSVVGCSPGTARKCPLLPGQVTRVRLRFRLHLAQPLAQAALVVAGPKGSAAVPAEVQVGVQRQLGPWLDPVAPLGVAGLLALLTVVLIPLLARRVGPGRRVTGRAGSRVAASEMALGAVTDSRAAEVLPRQLSGSEADVAPALSGSPRPSDSALSGSSLFGQTYAGAGSGPGRARGPGTSETTQPLEARPPARRTPFRREPIYAAGSWSAKDSWATNITALGGAVGSIAAAAGATSSIFPGVPLDRFAVLLALFSGVTVMAPLVLGMCLPRSDAAELVRANGFSLLVAAAVTLIGVGGEIGTIGSLIWLSSATRLVRECLLLLPAAVFAVVAWYACRTTIELVAHSRITDHHSSGLSAGRDSSITL